MEKFQLKRIYHKNYTFGMLAKDKVPFCVTLELPWNHNLKGISCIPQGIYICKLVKSPKYDKTFEITNVAGRDNILFHWGNFVSETRGCVLVGRNFTYMKMQPAIKHSLRTFKDVFLNKTQGLSEFQLEVR